MKHLSDNATRTSTSTVTPDEAATWQGADTHDALDASDDPDGFADVAEFDDSAGSDESAALDEDDSALSDDAWLAARFAELTDQTNYAFIPNDDGTWTAYGGPANLGSTIFTARLENGLLSVEADSGLAIPAKCVVEANTLSMFKNSVYVLAGFDPLPREGGNLRFSFTLPRTAFEDFDDVYDVIGKTAYSLRSTIPQYLQIAAGAAAYPLYAEEHEADIARHLDD